MASAQQEKHHRTGQKPRSTAYRTEVAYFKWAFPMYPSFDDVMPYDTIWVHPYSAIPFQHMANCASIIRGMGDGIVNPEDGAAAVDIKDWWSKQDPWLSEHKQITLAREVLLKRIQAIHPKAKPTSVKPSRGAGAFDWQKAIVVSAAFADRMKRHEEEGDLFPLSDEEPARPPSASSAAAAAAAAAASAAGSGSASSLFSAAGAAAAAASAAGSGSASSSFSADHGGNHR